MSFYLFCSYSEACVNQGNCTLVTFNIPQSVFGKPPHSHFPASITRWLYPNTALFLSERLILSTENLLHKFQQMSPSLLNSRTLSATNKLRYRCDNVHAPVSILPTLHIALEVWRWAGSKTPPFRGLCIGVQGCPCCVPLPLWSMQIQSIQSVDNDSTNV